jgi:hydroxymethylpyrimidine pyrophosphatase-like HAD family hydrolase
MLFASDLDRTLIYSKRFIEDNIARNKDLSLVEKYEGREISYMTNTAINLLKSINNKILFVPVTTRTYSQYSRINFIKDILKPEYAIISNGGNVLKNGEIDIEWNEKIKDELNRNCVSHIDVREKFKEISSIDWVLREYMAENLFYYFIIDQEKIPLDKVYDFEIWLKENKWTLSIQGRKLYLIPDCVDKWKAIDYVMDKKGIEKVVAAGDSLLDLKMLNKANLALSPYHGEIRKRVVGKTKDSNQIKFTRSEGFSASEDMLKDVIEYMENYFN